MSLLPRKALLAIAAVVDVALNARDRPVSAKALAARHGLPPRHLEPVLQALVHEGILRGLRGPHGGYALARERDSIGIDEIVRAAATVRASTRRPISESNSVRASRSQAVTSTIPPPRTRPPPVSTLERPLRWTRRSRNSHPGNSKPLPSRVVNFAIPGTTRN